MGLRGRNALFHPVYGNCAPPSDLRQQPTSLQPLHWMRVLSRFEGSGQITLLTVAAPLLVLILCLDFHQYNQTGGKVPSWS